MNYTNKKQVTITQIMAFIVLLAFSALLQAQSLDYQAPASNNLSTAAFNSIALSVASEDSSPFTANLF